MDDDDFYETCEIGDLHVSALAAICCPATSEFFFCTRDAGHQGRHVASAGAEIVDIWTDES